MKGMRSALIAGVAGQDGTLLADLLIRKGYHVVGAARSLSEGRQWRLSESGLLGHPQLQIELLDVVDAESCRELVERVRPDEVYNFAGVSFIGESFASPLHATHTTGLGAINLLEAIRTTCPHARFFQASSSEMFGRAQDSPQSEDTPFHPRSPYAVAKLFAHWATVNYRESYGIHASSGILYNHESPLRGVNFVTRKITDAVARIRLGQQDAVELGNMNSRRDWGYAPEYVEAMWRMLQAEAGGTFVLATGRLTTVRDFVGAAFRAVGTELRWEEQALNEIGVEADTGKIRVRVSPEYFRPEEANPLCGHPERARCLLGWEARIGVDEICSAMVQADLARLGGTT